MRVPRQQIEKARFEIIPMIDIIRQFFPAGVLHGLNPGR